MFCFVFPQSPYISAPPTFEQRIFLPLWKKKKKVIRTKLSELSSLATSKLMKFCAFFNPSFHFSWRGFCSKVKCTNFSSPLFLLFWDTVLFQSSSFPLFLFVFFSWLIILDQQFSTGVPQEFLKHAISDYLVRPLTSIFLYCQFTKQQDNDNSQRNNSSPVSESKLYLFLSDWPKICISCMLHNFCN